MNAATVQAFVDHFDVDPWDLTVGPDLPATPEPCHQCHTPVDVLVSTLGEIWVCLDCAVSLWRRFEEART